MIEKSKKISNNHLLEIFTISLYCNPSLSLCFAKLRLCSLTNFAATLHHLSLICTSLPHPALLLLFLPSLPQAFFTLRCFICSAPFPPIPVSPGLFYATTLFFSAPCFVGSSLCMLFSFSRLCLFFLSVQLCNIQISELCSNIQSAFRPHFSSISPFQD